MRGNRFRFRGAFFRVTSTAGWRRFWQERRHRARARRLRYGGPRLAGWFFYPFTRRILLYAVISVLLLLVLPTTLVLVNRSRHPHPPRSKSGTLVVSVWRTDIQKTVKMDLEEYVKGVVAAEMPAGFHLEALKAQAVAARTYAVRALRSGSSVPGHPEAVLSTDHRTDQAWISPEGLRQRSGWWGAYWKWRRITDATDQTRSLLATYAGEPILAAYHSTSGGATENSENYWSSSLPYLRGVHDPYSSHSQFSRTEVLFSYDELARKLAGQRVPAARGTAPIPVQVLERFPSGRVKSARIGNRHFSGREVRDLLQLRSNWFDVKPDAGGVRFVVRGYGHGIGMSQYGADGMAKAGYSYEAILKHYYQGIKVAPGY